MSSAATAAVASGFYETPAHGKVAKIQILTIAELFAGKWPTIQMIDPTAFRRPGREATGGQSDLFGKA